MTKFFLITILFMSFMIPMASKATECKTALAPRLDALTMVKNSTDGRTYNQTVYAGDNVAFSIMQYLFKAHLQQQVEELINSTAMAIRQQTKGNQVSQLKARQLGENPLELHSVLFSVDTNNRAKRIEAAAISVKDRCPVVWRYTNIGSEDRNNSLNKFLGLVGEWKHKQR